MKFYLVLAVTVTVVLGTFFYMKHQNEQQKIVAAEQAAAETAKANAAAEDAFEVARLREASRLAEEAEAAIGAGAEAAMVAGQSVAMEPAAKSAELKRVKVTFTGNMPNMKHKARPKYDHFEEQYIAGEADEDTFKFSSAQYSHTLPKAERKGRSAALSDDLLIVESQLEDRVERARR